MGMIAVILDFYNVQLVKRPEASFSSIEKEAFAYFCHISFETLP